jgi:alpha-mannosidase
VIEEGYRFNVPLHVFPTTAQPLQRSYFSVNNPAVVLDTVKKAEDSEEIIVRLYEAHGTHAAVRLITPLPVESVRSCNLLEDDESGDPIAWPDGGLSFTIKPFEIVTYKLKLKR